MDTVSYTEPNIEFNDAEWKIYRIRKDIYPNMNINDMLPCVCLEGDEKRVYLYTRLGNGTYDFFNLTGLEIVYLFTEKSNDPEWYIAWNYKSCYGRLKKSFGQYSMNIK